MNRIFTPIIHLALAGILSGGAISQAQQNSPTAKPVPITQIEIDSVEFQDAELPMVLDFLGSKAREFNGTPANFLLYDPLGELRKRDPKITLSLKNIPLSQVLKYVSDISGTTLQVDRNAALLARKEDLVLLKKLRNPRLTPEKGKAQIAQLGAIMLPRVELEEMSLRSAIEFLRLKTWESCLPDNPPNFVILPSTEMDPDRNVISLKLHKVSLLTVLQYVTESAGYSMRFDHRAIIIGQPGKMAFVKPVMRQNNPQFNLILNAKIEEVSIDKASMAEVLQLIAYHSRDPQTAPDGPNFITLAQTDKTVTLNLRKIRGIDVLRYLNEQTGTNFRVEKNVIAIIDRPPPKPKTKTK